MISADAVRDCRRPLSCYQDQSAADLRFHLLEGELAATQFTVLERGALSVAGIQLDASIIGASHWLRLRVDGGPDLHEVFACGPVVAGRESSRLAGPGTLPLRRVEKDLRNGRSYRFRAEVRSQSDAAERGLR